MIVRDRVPHCSRFQIPVNSTINQMSCIAISSLRRIRAGVQLWSGKIRNFYCKCNHRIGYQKSVKNSKHYSHSNVDTFEKIDQGVDVFFDYDDETILVSFWRHQDCDGDYDSNAGDDAVDAWTTIYCFSNAGEFRCQFKVPFRYLQLSSHPNGCITLVRHNRADTRRSK